MSGSARRETAAGSASGSAITAATSMASASASAGVDWGALPIPRVLGLLYTRERARPLTVVESNILVVGELDSEVRNGGFGQYFYNHGAHANLAYDALRATGLHEHGAVYARAHAVFPKGVPTETNARIEAVTGVSDSVMQGWNLRFDEWMSASKKVTVAEALAKYIAAHARELEP